MCALQLIAPKGGCHQFLFIVRCTPALPTPTEQSGLVPNPMHGSDRGSAVPALGLGFRKSGRFHLFSREEWSVTMWKPQPPWPTEMLRLVTQPLERPRRGTTAPELRAEAPGRQPRPAPAGQSPERPTRPRPVRSRCRTTRHHTPTGLTAAASLGPTGTRGQALPAHTGACLWVY